MERKEPHLAMVEKSAAQPTVAPLAEAGLRDKPHQPMPVPSGYAAAVAALAEIHKEASCCGAQAETALEDLPGHEPSDSAAPEPHRPGMESSGDPSAPQVAAAGLAPNSQGSSPDESSVPAKGKPRVGTFSALVLLWALVIGGLLLVLNGGFSKYSDKEVGDYAVAINLCRAWYSVYDANLPLVVQAGIINASVYGQVRQNLATTIADFQTLSRVADLYARSRLDAKNYAELSETVGKAETVALALLNQALSAGDIPDFAGGCVAKMGEFHEFNNYAWQQLNQRGTSVAVGDQIDTSHDSTTVQSSQTLIPTLTGIITTIQDGLKRLGYDIGPSDGSLGPKTRAAIADYQKKHGLAVTGQPSEALANTIRADAIVSSAFAQ